MPKTKGKTTYSSKSVEVKGLSKDKIERWTDVRTNDVQASVFFYQIEKFRIELEFYFLRLMNNIVGNKVFSKPLDIQLRVKYVRIGSSTKNYFGTTVKFLDFSEVESTFVLPFGRYFAEFDLFVVYEGTNDIHKEFYRLDNGFDYIWRPKDSSINYINTYNYKPNKTIPNSFRTNPSANREEFRIHRGQRLQLEGRNFLETLAKKSNSHIRTLLKQKKYSSIKDVRIKFENKVLEIRD